MENELTFLLDLLFDHKHAKEVEKAIRARVKAIQVGPTYAPPVQVRPQRPAKEAQSPSTQRILEQMAAEKLGQADVPPTGAVDSGVAPVSPVASQALADRQRIIQAAVNTQPFGVGSKETRARKF